MSRQPKLCSVVHVPVVVSFGRPPVEFGISVPYSTGTCHMAQLQMGGVSDGWPAAFSTMVGLNLITYRREEPWSTGLMIVEIT